MNSVSKQVLATICKVNAKTKCGRAFLYEATAINNRNVIVGIKGADSFDYHFLTFVRSGVV